MTIEKRDSIVKETLSMCITSISTYWMFWVQFLDKLSLYSI